MKLKAGTRIETNGYPGVTPEQLHIARWNEKVSGPRAEWHGWHIVRFADGGELCMHESRFRVIANCSRG